MKDIRHILKEKKIAGVILLEAVAVLLFAVCQILSWQEQGFHFQEENIRLICEDGEDIPSSYLDHLYTEVNAVATPEMDLAGGIYYINIAYQTNGPVRAGLAYAIPREDKTLVNGNEFSLNPDNSSVSYKAHIKDGTGVYVRLRLDGDAVEGDYVKLLNVNVVRSKLSCVYPVVCLIILLLTFDLILFALGRLKKGGNAAVIPILAAVAFLIGLPLYQDGYVGGIDLPFHLSRIEGIYEGLLEGQFPVKIQPGWLNGYGYAASVFYGDILLYFPALLRMAGFTLQDAMKAYLIAVNFLTTFSAYFSFEKCMKGRLASITAAILYVGAGDRLLRMYEGSQIGAVSAMIFYPVVFAGLYLLFTQEKEDRSCRTWLWLLVGFSGLLMTHLLSCLMVGIFSALACILCFRRLLRRSALKEAGKAFLAWLLLNGWFLVPFFQYMTSDLKVTSMLADEMLQPNYYVELAGYLKDCLDLSDLFSMRRLGYSLMIVLLLYPFLAVLDKRNDGMGRYVLSTNSEDRRNAESGIVFGLAVCALFVSTRAFPAVSLAKVNEIFIKLFQTIQYGNRFLYVAVPLLACVGGYLIVMLHPRYRYAGAGILCGLTLLQCLLSFEGYTTGPQFLEPVDFGTSLLTIGKGEYVPEGTDLTVLTRELWYDESALELGNVESRYLTYELTITNHSGEEQEIAFPIIYYEGYRGRDVQSDKRLETSAGINNRVTVTVPAGYSGTVRVGFEEYWYWRAAEAVSLAALAAIVLWVTGYEKKLYGRISKMMLLWGDKNGKDNGRAG